jgi:hypothetical protein
VLRIVRRACPEEHVRTPCLALAQSREGVIEEVSEVIAADCGELGLGVGVIDHGHGRGFPYQGLGMGVVMNSVLERWLLVLAESQVCTLGPDPPIRYPRNQASFQRLAYR